MNFNKICVLGLGYIGLPTASTFATHGLQVAGVDVNNRIVNGLQNGELHIHEPGLRTLVQAALRSGNLSVREQPEAADAFIIAVPTPFHEGKKADLRYVVQAAEAITPHLQRGNLVVLESTSPPRTSLDVVAPILERSGLKCAADFHLVYSPERVLPGQILRELIENARVIGGVDRTAAEAGRDLYRIFVRGEIILTDTTTAEMVKLMENTYRDVNIAIANEFSRLADRFGVNVWEAIEIANRHPRVNILNPGAGVGGHCISVDPWFLVEAAPELTPLIRTARMVNDGQPAQVVELVRRALGGDLHGKRVAALGLAYKPEVDDLRESPAIEVVHLLKDAGAVVLAYEPFKPNPALAEVETRNTLQAVCKDAEGLLLLVAHSSLRSLEPKKVAKETPARTAVDAVGGWNASEWEAAGFRFSQIGVG